MTLPATTPRGDAEAAADVRAAAPRRRGVSGMSRARRARPSSKSRSRGRCRSGRRPGGQRRPRRRLRRWWPRSARRPARGGRPTLADQEDHQDRLVAHQREVGGGAEERQRTEPGVAGDQPQPFADLPASDPAGRPALAGRGSRCRMPSRHSRETRKVAALANSPFDRARHLRDQTAGARARRSARRTRCRAAWRCPRAGRRAPGCRAGRRCRRSGRTPPPYPSAGRRPAGGRCVSRPDHAATGTLANSTQRDGVARPASSAGAAAGPPRRRPAGR